MVSWDPEPARIEKKDYTLGSQALLLAVLCAPINLSHLCEHLNHSDTTETMQRQSQRARSGTVAGTDRTTLEQRGLPSPVTSSVPPTEARVHATRTFSLGIPKPFQGIDNAKQQATQPGWQTPSPTQDPQQRSPGLRGSHSSECIYTSPSAGTSALPRNTVSSGLGRERPKIVTTAFTAQSTASATFNEGMNNSMFQPQVSVDARAERIRFLRVKAEEARLELLALEQLEREELDMQQTPEWRCSGNNGVASSDPDPTRVSKIRPHSQPSTSASACDKPPLYQSPLSHQPAQQRQQNSRNSVTRCESSVRRGRPDFRIMSRITRSTRSPTSAASSPSPPVSPLHPAQLINRWNSVSSDDEAATATARRVHMAHRSARTSTLEEALKCANLTRLQRLQTQREDDGSDGLLQDHLHNCKEDLMDTTLSDMMHRHLILLDDTDDTIVHGGVQESSDINSPEVFSEDVPSLLAETMPDNGSCDFSFIFEKPVSCSQPSPRVAALSLLTIPKRPTLLASVSPVLNMHRLSPAQGSQPTCAESQTGSPASEYSSAKEEFFPDAFTSRIRAPTTPTDLLLTAQSPSADTKEPAGRHPLDLIIIRPPNKDPSQQLDEQARPSTSGESSPWSDLCSDASTSSEVSTGSSWSWSWPSSITHSTGVSGASSPSDEHHRLRNMRSKASERKGVIIKSRSLASLIRQGCGWLGFQSLDLRLVASGQCHIVAVMQGNQVYSCWEPNDDDNDNDEEAKGNSEIEGVLGRCATIGAGTGFAQDTAAQPGLVQFQGQDALHSRVVKVVCSDSATFLMTENGDLWGWGTFKDAQGNAVGLIDRKIAPRPTLICAQSVKDVVCGRHHVLILSNSGDVISWGANERGQLGRQVHSVSSPDAQCAADLSPFFITDLPSNILGIGAGKVCSFAWDRERLYGWGDNTFGQLGALSARDTRTHTRDDDTPTSCRLEEHGVIVPTPRTLSLHWKGKSIKQVQGGAQHTVILTFSGLVMTMGNNDFGQLGVSSLSSPSYSLPVSPQDSYASDTSARSSPRGTMHASSKEREGSDSPSTATVKSTTRLFPALVRIAQGIKEISCGDHHTATCGHGGEMFLWGRGYDGILSVHNPLGKQGRGHTSSGHESPIPLASPLARERARTVVAVSTMRRCVSIALVSQ
ncbi:unnamed protein product [Mortierella alpina]